MNNTANTITLEKSPIPTINAAKRAWAIWFAATLFVLLQFFLQLTSGEIVDSLMKSFALNALGGGFLASTYYYTYASLQTPVGILFDRYGPRLLLTLGALIVGIGSVIFAYAPNLGIAILGRLLMGGGAAFAFVGTLYLTGQWFSPSRFAFMVALVETVGMLAVVASGYAIAKTVTILGWRDCMLVSAVIAFILAMILWVIIRDRPSGVLPAPRQSNQNLWQDLRCLIGNKIAWANGCYAGILFAVTTVFTALWAIPFLQVSHHLSLVQATLLASMVFLGVAVGGPVIGWLDNHVPSRRLLMMVCALVSAVLISGIVYFSKLPLIILAMLLLLLGTFSSSYILAYAVGSEIVPLQLRSTSIGFVNTFAVGTAPLLQPLIGFFLSLGAHEKQSVITYPLWDYDLALTVFPLLLLVAAWLACWIPNQKTK